MARQRHGEPAAKPNKGCLDAPTGRQNLTSRAGKASTPGAWGVCEDLKARDQECSQGIQAWMARCGEWEEIDTGAFETHREVLNGVALAAVPAVRSNEGEEEEQQCSNEHNAHCHSRVIQIICA